MSGQADVVAPRSFIAASALGHVQVDDAAVAKYYARVAGVALPDRDQG